MIEVRASELTNYDAGDADVCIVGAGIAGMVLAYAAARQGLRVIVLEAGDRNVKTFEEGRDVIFTRRVYRGATFGRCQGLGGTGNVWGGAIIPYVVGDVEERPWIGARKWVVSHGEIERWWRDVETLFGFDESPYTVEAREKERSVGQKGDEGPAFLVRLAKWPKFGKRNVGAWILRQYGDTVNFVVGLGCRVIGFDCDREEGKIKAARYVDCRDNAGRVQARWFVLTPGAIEATRLLLILDRDVDGKLSPGSAALGRGLVDHLSVRVGQIVPYDVEELNYAVGLRFEKYGMRSVRFELSADSQTKYELPNVWAHISGEAINGGAFVAVREMLRELQKGKTPPVWLVGRAVGDWRSLAKLVYWRFVKKRLRWPDQCRVGVDLVIEQRWREENRIELDNAVSEGGVPRVKITWDIGQDEISDFAKGARCFKQWWEKRSFGRYGKIYIDQKRAEETIEVVGCDIFHPCGTTRMGNSKASSVVDRNLVVWGTKNLSVLSTSVFPSVGGANPTGTLLALAFRHAAFLKGTLRES